MPINPAQAKQRVCNFELRKLFNEIGWDKPGAALDVPLDGHTFHFQPVAEKRGLQVFECAIPASERFPDYATRQKLERQVVKSAKEHILIFTDAAKTQQVWLWVKREANSPARSRQVTFVKGQTGEALVQKLQHLVFELEEEDRITLPDVTARRSQAFDVEKITKRFFERFQQEHAAFLKFIKGLPEESRAWYASLMLNRLMFVYFIQKKRFLNNDPDYLRNKLKEVQARKGKDKFDTFYRYFLLRLFHEGLGKKKDARKAEYDKLLGDVPYLNGGLFDVHELEAANADIAIPDSAFTKLFEFFDAYQWHLDDRPLRADNEINPDVLGFIFEKYINQKQMGAYYTKEDITGYITRNAVLPFVLGRVQELCAVAFQPGGTVWSMLKDDPDRYIYDAVRTGVDGKLPDDIAAGIGDVSKRGGWNKPAAEAFALPTETWREHVARRQRCEELRKRLKDGKVTAVNDLVTLNLDIVRFVTDMIVECEGADLLLAIYQTLTKVSVLDLTCGSGAFLFAALNILEPLYDACLDRMQVFVEEADATGKPEAKERHAEFRDVLKEAARHPNRRYFIFRSVVVNNLFGVDIMDEAVEICKLRLFLKLVSQVETAKDIEPLPDIDFNIRPGNTLVGFASVEEVRKAMQDSLDYYDEVEAIEKKAAGLDQKFLIFRRHQTSLKDDNVRVAWTKQDLRKSLRDLGDELDRYLAGVYGVDPDDEKKYAKWHDSHKPFHWFAEFYGIMTTGGFDVVIGNPPYVQLSEIDSYRLLSYSTEKCGNLYAIVLERCGKLTSPNGRQGYIVPVSSISTEGYSTLQAVLRARFLCYSSFDDRPSRLFDGLEHIRLSIHLIGSPCSNPSMTSTQYNKWSKDERPFVFEKLTLTSSRSALVEGTFPKLFHPLEASILTKLERQGHTLAEYFNKTGEARIFYSRKVGYFLQVLDFQPDVRDGKGKLRDPSEFKTLQFASAAHAQTALCCLNANLFYWFVTVFSDCRHLNKREVECFPIDLAKLTKSPLLTELQQRARALMKSLKSTSDTRTMRFKHDTLTVQCIIPKHSKPIIDEIDELLAKHYGFTAEELDFIVNYDIKYRLGAEDGESDAE